jgi:hypothetical protein
MLISTKQITMSALLTIIKNYSTDGIINNVPQEELMNAFRELQNSSSKEPKKSKKVHDPNAPKRPTSSYMFWLNENRSNIRETYFSDYDSIEEWDIKSKKEYYLSKGLEEGDKEGKPRIVALITSKAGLLWKELDPEVKEPFEIKFKEAQDEYKTLKMSYRPSLDCDRGDSLEESPSGWEGPHCDMTIDKTIKDEDGKTIKIFKSFTEAIECAESLGIKCYGITQTKRGFSVRVGNLKKCDKSIASWTKSDYEKPIKSTRGRPKKTDSETDELTPKSNVINDSDSDSDNMDVQEITFKGKSYYLNEKNNNVYDPETTDYVGKYTNEKIVFE